MVNIRRLQQTGGKNGSSFLIILPKDWVRRQDLSKGDLVVVAEREDGCLIIDPRLPRAGETRSTTIQIEENLRWAITSKYLLGFDEIHVLSQSPISNSQRDELKGIIKRFVALEVTDEDDHKIVVQCLVDPSTLPVHKAMRRINLIATRMFNDGLKAYFEGDKGIALDVVERDEEVDRLFFLIVRELRSAIQYPRISERLGITPVEALDFRLAAQYIERIADLAVDIAEKAEDKLGTKLVKKIEPLVSKVRDMLAKSVTNLFKFDSEKVAQVIAAEKELIDDTLKLRNHLIASPGKNPQTHLYVVDSLLRIGEAAKDIVDLALPQS
ncbi:MAG: PhoU domain-containing protein [Candidatus Thorarchaeota archaeon]|jgi:phosphate uptake regulator